MVQHNCLWQWNIFVIEGAEELCQPPVVALNLKSYSECEAVWLMFCLHFWVNSLFWSIYRSVFSYLSVWFWQYDINGRSVRVRKHPVRLIVPIWYLDGLLFPSHMNIINSLLEMTRFFSDNDVVSINCLDSSLPICCGIVKLLCGPIFALLTHNMCRGIWNRYLC